MGRTHLIDRPKSSVIPEAERSEAIRNPCFRRRLWIPGSDAFRVRPGMTKHKGATPTGAQSARTLRRSRWLVAILNGVTYAAFAALLARVMAASGWTAIDVIAFACALIALPWAVLGFWNAAIGFFLLRFARDPLHAVLPHAAAAGDQPIAVRTAVLMTLRNEDPARAFARLRAVKQSLDETGYGAWFSYFVLSDTSEPAIAEAEEAAFEAFKREAGEGAIVYRRRPDNEGFKAGNLRDFCERWGGDYELMLPLDADSLMSGEAILALVRIMQAHPRLGVLQSLIVGMPSMSAFARIFQFGMRHGMRSYTSGAAWWIGDCGPFWGHNAAVRIAPFRDHCALPRLPGKPPLGGHVLSHDQIEAVLMRRAGFEVRVLPVEGGSYEENPPTALEFVRRDLRWCLGNMQYLKLLGLKGLTPTSRFQLFWAILMFVGVPASTLAIALSPFLVAEARAVADYPGNLALALYLAFLLMHLTPKLAGIADVALTKGALRRYGGAWRFWRAVAIELAFSFLLGALATFRTAMFMVGLAFGKAMVGWGGQARDAHRVSWRAAFAALWPQLLFGLYVCGSLAVLSPRVLAWASPLVAGYLAAIPFAVWTASPRVGAWFARLRLCAVPEEFDPPPVIRALQTTTSTPS